MPRYTLFGLTIDAALELPELECAPDGSEADVRIGLGAVPAGPVPPVELAALPEGALLTVAQVGRYLIRDGVEIVVEPAPGAEDAAVRLFLLGSAMGALLHQRGLLPLHANAVEIGGRAVAFMGPSGSGKSTLAAQFHDRGHAMLSDDVCAIRFENGVPMAQPGLPRMRLWRDALARSGRDPDAFPPVLGDRDKFTVPARSGAGPLPLGAVFLLERADDAAGAAVRRLQGAEAIEALVSNTYRGRYLREIGNAQAHWAMCLRLVQSSQVFTVARPWDLDAVESGAAEVERQLG